MTLKTDKIDVSGGQVTNAGDPTSDTDGATRGWVRKRLRPFIGRITLLGDSRTSLTKTDATLVSSWYPSSPQRAAVDMLATAYDCPQLEKIEMTFGSRTALQLQETGIGRPIALITSPLIAVTVQFFANDATTQSVPGASTGANDWRTYTIKNKNAFGQVTLGSWNTLLVGSGGQGAFGSGENIIPLAKNVQRVLNNSGTVVTMPETVGSTGQANPGGIVTLYFPGGMLNFSIWGSSICQGDMESAPAIRQEVLTPFLAAPAFTNDQPLITLTAAITTTSSQTISVKPLPSGLTSGQKYVLNNGVVLTLGSSPVTGATSFTATPSGTAPIGAYANAEKPTAVNGLLLLYPSPNDMGVSSAGHRAECYEAWRHAMARHMVYMPFKYTNARWGFNAGSGGGNAAWAAKTNWNPWCTYAGNTERLTATTGLGTTKPFAEFMTGPIAAGDAVAISLVVQGGASGTGASIDVGVRTDDTVGPNNGGSVSAPNFAGGVRVNGTSSATVSTSAVYPNNGSNPGLKAIIVTGLPASDLGHVIRLTVTAIDSNANSTVDVNWGGIIPAAGSPVMLCYAPYHPLTGSYANDISGIGNATVDDYNTNLVDAIKTEFNRTEVFICDLKTAFGATMAALQAMYHTDGIHWNDYANARVFAAWDDAIANNLVENVGKAALASR